MSDELLYSDRECLFAELLAAFGRRDHDVIRASMRPDVVLVLPGSSPLAGTHRDRRGGTFRRRVEDSAPDR
jgi:ketosteroid isomerase-like protein